MSSANCPVARRCRRHVSLVTLIFFLGLSAACSNDTPGNDGLPVSTPAAQPEPEQTRSTIPRFTDIAAQSGLNFIHHNGATAEKFFPEIMGSGGAFIDYDNDGDLDILVVQSGRINQSTAPLFDMPATQNHLRLYRNDLDESGPRFSDVSDDSGLTVTTYGMGVAVGDLNNDGYADIYYTDLSTNALFMNNGDGTFRREASGIAEADAGWFTSASFLDYDLDGNLDLFVIRYVDVDLVNARRCMSGDGQRDYCTPDVFKPQTDFLLKGDGTGKLVNMANWHVGPPAPKTGLGVIVADYDGNGTTDVYVANDKKANQLWLNPGDGPFEEVAVMNGLAYDANGKAEASMGVTSGDVDADGDEDLFVTHLKGESNTLYLNEGNAMFVDSTVVFKLSSTSLPSTGFGTGWFDPDNDGDLDLFAANGAVMIERSQLDVEPFPYVQANQLFEHRSFLEFSDGSAQAGFADETPEVSRGAAFGDVDNDGDIDILVTNNNGPVRLLRNDLDLANNWLTITVIGTTANRDAAGGRIGIERDGAPTLWRRIGTDGSYLSANDRRVHFGLGNADSIEGIVVNWPGNKLERFDPVPLNQYITVTEGQGRAAVHDNTVDH